MPRPYHALSRHPPSVRLTIALRPYAASSPEHVPGGKTIALHNPHDAVYMVRHDHELIRPGVRKMIGYLAPHLLYLAAHLG